MTSEERDPWGWVGAETPPDTYQPVWVSPLSYLIPMRSGAVLRWVYDESEILTYSALVRLTEQEAQRICGLIRQAACCCRSAPHSTNGRRV